MKWFQLALSRYADFTGRSQRSEYWFFFLFYFLAVVVISVVGGVIGSETLMNLLLGVLMLAFFVPGLAVGVRRLHDVGRSGWWLLISLVPLIGALLLLFWAVSDSAPGDNQFGPNPKGLSSS